MQLETLFFKVRPFLAYFDYLRFLCCKHPYTLLSFHLPTHPSCLLHLRTNKKQLALYCIALLMPYSNLETGPYRSYFFNLSYSPLIITPLGGPYPIRVPLYLSWPNFNQRLVFRSRLSCKAGVVVGCRIGCSVAQQDYITSYIHQLSM